MQIRSENVKVKPKFHEFTLLTFAHYLVHVLGYPVGLKGLTSMSNYDDQDINVENTFKDMVN